MSQEERSITDIVQDCYTNCTEYRKIDKELLRTTDYKYSCSSETQEALEEADPTGRQLEKYCTNLDEIAEHDDKWQEIHHAHVKSCLVESCRALHKYRADKGIYEELDKFKESS